MFDKDEGEKICRHYLARKAVVHSGIKRCVCSDFVNVEDTDEAMLPYYVDVVRQHCFVSAETFRFLIEYQ